MKTAIATIAVSACLAMVYLTHCKAAITALIGMAAWRGYWLMPRRIDRVCYSVAAVTLAVIGLMAWVGKTNSFVVRWQYSQNALYILSTRPITGYGAGMYGPVYRAFDEPVVETLTKQQGKYPRRAHNDWMQAAVEHGIPYALAMFAMWCWWCYTSAKRGDWAVSLSLFGLGLLAAMDFPLQMPVHFTLFWLIGGLCATQSR